jgi:competence protein ComGF
MSDNVRDFNNIETRAVIKLFFLQGKALKEIHAILTDALGEHAPLYATIKNWVIFPPVMHLVLDDPKQ